MSQRFLRLSLVLCFLTGATVSSAAQKKPAGKSPAAGKKTQATAGKALVAKKPAGKNAPKTFKITYDDHVQPIFRAKCFACHNTNKKSGGLDLTTYTNLMQGGSSGEVIVPGNAGDSYLYNLVSHESEPFMPPKSEKLAKTSLELIRKWIDGGALQNSGSKPVARRKTFDFSLKTAPVGRPAGPAPMPAGLSRQPLMHSRRATAVTALATSPWAPLVAVAGQKQVLLYHTQTLQLLGVLPFPEGVPHVLKFSRNGALLLAGGGKDAFRGRVVVWNVKTGQRVVEVGDELDTVLAADISADHRFIALGGPQKLVRIYSTETGKLLHEIKKHTEWIYAVEFSPDGVLLATADRNGGMFVWETFTAREYLSLKGHRGAITGLSWRSDSNLLASCSEDGSVRLWEMQNGRSVRNWTAHSGGTLAVEFTRNGRLVTCGRDRTTRLWDQNGKALRTFPAFPDIAVRVTHCDETDRVIAGDWTGLIRVWNSADGKQAGEISANPPLLQDQLKEARQRVSQLEKQAQALAAARQQAQQALTQLQSQLAAARQTVAEARKTISSAEASLKKNAGIVSALKKEEAALSQQVQQLQAVLPPLTQAVEKGDEAARKAPQDKTLATAVATLKAERAKKTALLATVRKVLQEKTAARLTVEKQQAALEKQIASARSQLAAAEKRLQTLSPRLKPAQAKVTQTTQAASSAAALLATARKTEQQLRQELQREQQRASARR